MWKTLLRYSLLDFVLVGLVATAQAEPERLTTRVAQGQLHRFLSSPDWRYGDHLWRGNSGYDLMWDTSVNTLHFEDNTELGFGNTATAPDVYFAFDATNFEMFAAAADTPWAIGAVAAGFDITYYFETAGQLRTDYDGDFINLTDDMELRFGTGASSDGDLKISSNSSNVLQIEQVVADTGTIELGADGTDIPTKWYAETAGDYFEFTADQINLVSVDVVMSDSAVATMPTIIASTDVHYAYKTVIKTISFDDDASADDFQFDDDAANQTEQPIDLGALVPAYAEIVAVQIRCFEAVVGGTMSVDIGVTTGAGDVLAAVAVDALNEVFGGAAASAPLIGVTNAARNIWVNATPSANWNTLTAGRYAVMVTYLDFGAVYTQDSP
ncbi:hypothetical protein CMI37_23045 [Candidatus Pacearchaeota archaeon]|nr:hypothetical protein [Candidatus Pacearchaeota archaeon]